MSVQYEAECIELIHQFELQETTLKGLYERALAELSERHGGSAPAADVAALQERIPPTAKAFAKVFKCVTPPRNSRQSWTTVADLGVVVIVARGQSGCDSGGEASD